MKTAVIISILGLILACSNQQFGVNAQNEQKLYFADGDNTQAEPEMAVEETQQLQPEQMMLKRVPHPAWRQKGRVQHIQHMPEFGQQQSGYSNFVSARGSRPLFMRYARRNRPFIMPQIDHFNGIF